MFNRRVLVFGMTAAMVLVAPHAVSDARGQQVASAAAEQAILTISGKLREGRAVEMTRADIERLPRTTIRTATPWHDGVQVFEGVLLEDLIAYVGGVGPTLRVTALNNYVSEIPAVDARTHKPLLAYLRNGQPMSIRDKGPLFIIYPYDSDPSLKTEVYFSRSPWQVRMIDIR